MDAQRGLPPDLAELVPPGHLVTAKTPLRTVVETEGGDWNWERQGIVGPPIGWASDDPVPEDLWRRLHAEHPTSGWWPLLILDGVGDNCLGFFGEDEESLADLDAEDRLRDWWNGFGREILSRDEQRVLGMTREWWPGLAPAATPRAAADEVAREQADQLARHDEEARLALIPASRGADALGFGGWSVTDDEEHFTGALAVVVRTWEERFGARVIGVGQGTLFLSVAAPPTTLEDAMRVAIEHLAFCPEVEPREDYDYDSANSHLSEYARSIMDYPLWRFWWD